MKYIITAIKNLGFKSVSSWKDIPEKMNIYPHFILALILIVPMLFGCGKSGEKPIILGDMTNQNECQNCSDSPKTMYIENIINGKYEIRPSGLSNGKAELYFTSTGNGIKQYESDIDQLLINIKEVQFVTDEETIINVPVISGYYDLLKLKDESEKLFAGSLVPKGTYTQVRLVLNDENGKVIKNGNEFPLKVPSGAQSGLKLIGDIKIYSGIVYKLTLDFDLEDLKWNKGVGYILRPVIKIKNIESMLPFMPGYLVVKLKNKIQISYDESNGTPITGIGSLDSLTAKFNCIHIENIISASAFSFPNLNQDLLSELGIDRYYIFAFKDSTDVIDAIIDYQKNPNIESANLDILHNTELSPNDPYANPSTGSQHIYINDINAYNGWDLETGKSDIRVAVVDTGVLDSHPDLLGKIIHGRSFYVSTCIFPIKYQDVIHWVPYYCLLCTNETNPVVYHGTLVAGIIGAVTNNSQGIAGLNWTSPIISVRASQPEKEYKGGATELAVGMSILESVNMGARVINISMGGYGYEIVDQFGGRSFTCPTELNAVQYAKRAGVVLVAASGNENQDVSGYPGTPSYQAHYPSSFQEVISVGALNTGTSQRASFSNYGKVDITAPGTSIVSTYYNINGTPQYAYAGGTSMASPMVAALASLILSRNPTLSPDSVFNIMRNSATDVGPAGKPDNETGWGRINFYQALSSTPSPVSQYAVPFYRFYNGALFDHFYEYREELFADIISSGYVIEGIACLILSSPDKGAVPFHRLRSSSCADHFYTISDSEVAYAQSIGYIYEGIAGYIFADQEPGTVPLYRLLGHSFFGLLSDHFYTISDSEVIYAQSIGYIYEGIAGYVYPYQ